MKLPYGIPDHLALIGAGVVLSWLLSALWAIRMRRRLRAALAAERAARTKAEQDHATERQRTIRLSQELAHPANPGMEPVVVRARAKVKAKPAPKAQLKKRAPKTRPTRFDRINDPED